MSKELSVQIREEWIKALRSGEYAQCGGALRKYADLNNLSAGFRYCCLGVLTDVATKITGTNYWNYDMRRLEEVGELCSPLTKLMGLHDGSGVMFDYDDIDPETSLAELNDEGTSFGEIANILEYSPNKVFSVLRKVGV